MRFFLLVLVLLATVPLFGGCRSQGGPLEPGSLATAIAKEAQPVPVSIKDEENGWTEVRRVAVLTASSDVPREPLELVYAPKLDKETAAKALAALSKANARLDSIRDAAGKSRWLVEHEGSATMDGTGMGMIKLFLKALVCRGRARIIAGQVDEGVRDQIAAREIAFGILGGHASMSQGLAAVSCLTVVNRALERQAADPAVPSAAIQALLDGLPDPPDADAAVQNCVREELSNEIVPNVEGMADPRDDPESIMPGHLYTLSLLGMLKGEPGAFDRKGTVEVISAGCAILIENLGKPWPDQRPLGPFIRDLVKEFPAGLLQGTKMNAEQSAAAKRALVKLKNPIGRLIALIVLPTFDQFADTSFTWRAEQEAVRTILAIRLWRDGHSGALPASLDALVQAGLLKRAPRDFFAKVPLRYDPARRVLWSVGKDGIDGGGKDAPDTRGGRSADLVWPALGV